MTDTTTLGDALPARMKEIREEYIPAYQSIGLAGGFAIAMMNMSLTKAERALAEGDVIAMIEAYKELQDFKL
jgi:molybdopterin converting factor small subunit